MREALEPHGFTDINVNCTTKTCTFKAPADADVSAILDEVAGKERRLKDWSKN